MLSLYRVTDIRFWKQLAVKLDKKKECRRSHLEEPDAIDSSDEVIQIYKKYNNIPSSKPVAHKKRTSKKNSKRVSTTTTTCCSTAAQNGSEVKCSSTGELSKKRLSKRQTKRHGSKEVKKEADCNNNSMESNYGVAVSINDAERGEGSDSNYVSQTEHMTGQSLPPSEGTPSRDSGEEGERGDHLSLGNSREWKHLPWLHDTFGRKVHLPKAIVCREKSCNCPVKQSSAFLGDEGYHLRLNEDWVNIPDSSNNQSEPDNDSSDNEWQFVPVHKQTHCHDNSLPGFHSVYESGSSNSPSSDMSTDIASSDVDELLTDHSQMALLSTGSDTMQTVRDEGIPMVENTDLLGLVTEPCPQRSAHLSHCGRLQVTFNYFRASSTMKITIHKATDLPKHKGGVNNVQIHMLQVPAESPRFKTHIKSMANPTFEQSFCFKIPLDAVLRSGIRFCVYGCAGWIREYTFAECEFKFVKLNLGGPSTRTLLLRALDIQQQTKDDFGSMTSLNGGIMYDGSALSAEHVVCGNVPRLMIGLSCCGTTGNLLVEIIKGSHFGQTKFDTYIKLNLLSPNGAEIIKRKTDIKENCQHPWFKETFQLSVHWSQLQQVTLVVSAYRKTGIQNQMIGWFCLGHTTSSGEAEHGHWIQMIDDTAQISRWHTLIEP